MHVEKVLRDDDFEPDAFATADDAKSPISRLSSGFPNSDIPVLRRDDSWDFIDVDLGRAKPPVYSVVLEPDNFKRDTKN